jgi:hypothetical protein
MGSGGCLDGCIEEIQKEVESLALVWACLEKQMYTM